jgi:hypothetical protein
MLLTQNCSYLLKTEAAQTKCVLSTFSEQKQTTPSLAATLMLKLNIQCSSLAHSVSIHFVSSRR